MQAHGDEQSTMKVTGRTVQIIAKLDVSSRFTGCDEIPADRLLDENIRQICQLCNNRVCS